MTTGEDKLTLILTQIVPLGLQDLRNKAQDWGLDANSSQFPGVPVWRFYAVDGRGVSRNFKPLHLAWGIREEKDDGWGIGILPLVEIFGAINAEKFPSRNALEKEMVSLLRAFAAPAQHTNLTNLGEALESSEKPVCPAAKITSIWPKFREFKTPTSSAISTPSSSRQGPSAAETPTPTVTGKTRQKLSGKAQPIKASKLTKYAGEHGLFLSSDLNNEIPNDIKETLVNNANASLAYQTWRSIKSVRRRVLECERETDRDLSLPWNQVKLTIFTGWCLKRNLRDKTVQNYISKVNISHQCCTHLI